MKSLHSRKSNSRSPLRLAFFLVVIVALSLAALMDSEASLSLSWASLGPHNINGPSNTLASGKLQALAVFNSNPNIMYAGGGVGSGNEGPWTEAGAFKTINAGASWTRINTGLLDHAVNALWVDQGNSNVVVAGTERGGIFKSTNGGGGWSLVGNFGPTSEFVLAGANLLAATGAGIAQSTNLGSSWSIIQSTVSPVRALATGGGRTIAGLENGNILMQSSPGGAWKTVRTNSGRTLWSVAIDPATPTTAYAALGLNPSVLLRTLDGGTTWSSLTLPSSGGSQAVAMTPTSHVLYLGGNGSLFSTSNAGSAWTKISNFYGFFDVRKIFLLPAQSAIILGTDQGLQKTTNNGASWVCFSASVSSSMIAGFAVNGSTILTGVQDFSPILSFDAGSNWQQPLWTAANPPVGEDGTMVINSVHPSYCYTYTTNGYQYSTDSGHSFYSVAIAGLGPGTYVQPGGVNIVAVDPVTPTTVYAASKGGIFKSVNSGVTMNPTGWALTQATVIAISPSSSSTIYVGTISGLYKTVNGGTNWTKLSLGASGYPTTIAIDPHNPSVLLVGLSNGPASGGGVLRSVDAGAHFNLVNTGLATGTSFTSCCGVDMLSLRIRSDLMVALATRTGIYLSADLGTHWQNISANSISHYFSDVAWQGSYLYTSTFGEGVLRAEIPFRARTDFNLDGHPDYVIYNASTRSTTVWYLNNNVYLSAATGPTLSAGWKLMDVADFNRDGKPDFAVFNPTTRQTAIWYLSGASLLVSASGPTLPSGYVLGGTADFNGDGKPDYLLYNGSTGQTIIWYLNNNVYVSAANGPTLPAGWRFVGAEDFNRDGKSDYLLFNPSTRQSAIWYLSGAALLSSVSGPTLPSGYVLTGAADFNGDGKPDYVLYNPGTRQTTLWYLNNNVYTSAASGPTLPSGWSLIQP